MCCSINGENVYGRRGGEGRDVRTAVTLPVPLGKAPGALPIPCRLRNYVVCEGAWRS